jgi:Helix-turn-helix domain
MTSPVAIQNPVRLSDTMGWVFDSAPVNPGQLLVLLALADHARDDGTGAYPCIATLARKTRMGRSTVLQHMKDLKKLAVIQADGERPRKPGQAGQAIVSYQIVMDADERHAILQARQDPPKPTVPNLDG